MEGVGKQELADGVSCGFWVPRLEESLPAWGHEHHYWTRYHHSVPCAYYKFHFCNKG